MHEDKFKLENKTNDFWLTKKLISTGLILGLDPRKLLIIVSNQIVETLLGYSVIDASYLLKCIVIRDCVFTITKLQLFINAINMGFNRT